MSLPRDNQSPTKSHNGVTEESLKPGSDPIRFQVEDTTPPASELVNSDPSVYEIDQMRVRHQLEQAEALKENIDDE